MIGWWMSFGKTVAQHGMIGWWPDDSIYCSKDWNKKMGWREQCPHSRVIVGDWMLSTENVQVEISCIKGRLTFVSHQQHDQPSDVNLKNARRNMWNATSVAAKSKMAAHAMQHDKMCDIWNEECPWCAIPQQNVNGSSPNKGQKDFVEQIRNGQWSDMKSMQNTECDEAR